MELEEQVWAAQPQQEVLVHPIHQVEIEGIEAMLEGKILSLLVAVDRLPEHFRAADLKMEVAQALPQAPKQILLRHRLKRLKLVRKLLLHW